MLTEQLRVLERTDQRVALHCWYRHRAAQYLLLLQNASKCYCYYDNNSNRAIIEELFEENKDHRVAAKSSELRCYSVSGASATPRPGI